MAIIKHGVGVGLGNAGCSACSISRYKQREIYSDRDTFWRTILQYYCRRFIVADGRLCRFSGSALVTTQM